MDGKKKKNKKKKGNQGRPPPEDAASDSKEAAAHDQGLAAEENHHHAPRSSHGDAQSVTVSESDMEIDKQRVFEAKCEEVRRLEDERNIWLQREAGLEEKISHLQNEVGSCLKNEATLEEKLNNLQIRNDALIEKEVILEDRVKHIEDAKDSWNLKEISIKGMISRLEEVNTDLQTQVKELEESKSSLFQENLKLIDCISALELRIQHLEKEASFNKSSAVMTEFPEEGNLIHKSEEAVAPLENLDAKNPKSAEKDCHGTTSEYSSTPKLSHVETPPVTPASPRAYVAEYDEMAYDSGKNIQSLVNKHEMYGVTNGEELVTINRLHPGQSLHLDEPRISEEIVQIPLDDVQVQEADSQAIKNDKTAGVPLSDAPLIGAPFRLISFCAKYVSGADLVDQSSSSKPAK